MTISTRGGDRPDCHRRRVTSRRSLRPEPFTPLLRRHPFALLMHYDAEGRFLKGELSDDPAVIDRCRRQRDLALANSVSLQEFLSATAASRS